jgi:hypothetical protein
MKYIKYLSIIALFTFIFSGCSPMDEKYREFIVNGPDTYIAKLNPDSINLYSGRNRIKFSWSKSTDPRGKHAVVYWANKAEKYETYLNLDGRTEFVIENLAEGSYIFDIYLTDDFGNSSISTTVTGEVYGANYEKYLINRAVIDFSMKANNGQITFADIVDHTIINTEIEWKQGSIYKANVDSAHVTGILSGFKALSFRYRTVYVPGAGAIDKFYSPYTYYLINNVEPGDITVEKTNNTLTFTLPDKVNDIIDDYWKGFRISWNGGSETKIINTPIAERKITIPNYSGTEIAYQTCFQFDGMSDNLYSAEKVFSTVSK